MTKETFEIDLSGVLATVHPDFLIERILEFRLVLGGAYREAVGAWRVSGLTAETFEKIRNDELLNAYREEYSFVMLPIGQYENIIALIRRNLEEAQDD